MERNLRKTRVGTVVSDKMDKTVVVAIYDNVRHPLYKKIVKRTVKIKAHDEANACHEGDKVLVIDDFLAKGAALDGLTTLIKDSGAELVGAGIVIEKGFQDGGERIRAKGVRVESLAIVDSMDETTGEIVFRNEE